MRQIVLVTTLFGAMTAAAAIDQGALGDGYSERILLAATNAPIPEVVDPLFKAPGAAAVVKRFDRTLLLNDLIDPQHPSQWRVETIDAPTQERLLRRYWGLGDDEVELVIESVHVPPAATLARIFPNARVHVLSEGLMSYGATRDPQDRSFGQRIEALVHLDLVEGLTPLLLSEHHPRTVAVTPEQFRALVEEMAEIVSDRIDEAVPPSDEPTALVLGQYLSAIGLMSVEDEVAQQVDMVALAGRRGATRVLFKAHPSAPPSDVAAIADAARRMGIDLVVVRDPIPAEVLLARVDVMVVIACFSTALVTAHRVFGIPIDSVGAQRMIRALKPYQNSNRIPATVIRALTRTDGLARTGPNLQALMVAVAYCMQPRTFRHGRTDAERFLETLSATERADYFQPRRLGALGLPGGRPSRVRQLGEWGLRFMPTRGRAVILDVAKRALRRVR